MHRVETRGDGNTIFFCEMGMISSSISEHPKNKNKSCVHQKTIIFIAPAMKNPHTWFHLKKRNSIKKSII